MSTPTIEQIHAHRSIRRYRPDPVPADLVETIVAAGQRASTSSNLQLYSAVAVADPQRRARLAELCGGQAHIPEAPVFVAWCADRHLLDRACALRGHAQTTEHVEDFLVAAVDVAILMQTAALAAESLGLGMCYIGAIRNDPQGVIELLHLPRLVFPIAGMTLGWPDAAPPPKPRLPPGAVLHWERYDTAGRDDALRAYDQTMVDTGIYRGRQVPVPGHPEQSEDYGWLEHSARRASQPARTGLRPVLEAQGFPLR